MNRNAIITLSVCLLLIIVGVAYFEMADDTAVYDQQVQTEQTEPLTGETDARARYGGPEDFGAQQENYGSEQTQENELEVEDEQQQLQEDSAGELQNNSLDAP